MWVVAPTTKTPALPARTCKWLATTPRPMLNRKLTLGARFPSVQGERARCQRQLRDHSTFSSAFLERNGRQPSRRRLQAAVAFNNQCRSNEQMKDFAKVSPLEIAQLFEIYVRQSEENFRSRLTPNRKQVGSQCRKTRAAGRFAREKTTPGIKRRRGRVRARPPARFTRRRSTNTKRVVRGR